jgi:hypothetical protein
MSMSCKDVWIAEPSEILRFGSISFNLELSGPIAITWFKQVAFRFVSRRQFQNKLHKPSLQTQVEGLTRCRHVDDDSLKLCRVR